MSELDLALRCDVCGKTERPKVFQKWAPEGCLEIRGATSFYVDGERIRCKAHTDQDLARKQRQARAYERDAAHA